MATNAQMRRKLIPTKNLFNIDLSIANHVRSRLTKLMLHTQRPVRARHEHLREQKHEQHVVSEHHTDPGDKREGHDAMRVSQVWRYLVVVSRRLKKGMHQ